MKRSRSPFHKQCPLPRRSPAVVQAMPSMKFCEICMEKKEEDKMFTVQSCKHFFCTECITRHVETKVMTDSVPDVKCPSVGCKLGLVDINSCNNVVSKECLSKWDELFCASVLFLDPNLKFYCPYKNCSGLLLRDTDEVIREAECPHCRRLFCAQCRVPWHSGVRCEQLQQLGEDEKGTEAILFRELAKEKKWTRCPACLYYVERSHGCSEMKCRCGSVFCYACGGKWILPHCCPRS